MDQLLITSQNKKITLDYSNSSGAAHPEYELNYFMTQGKTSFIFPVKESPKIGEERFLHGMPSRTF